MNRFTAADARKLMKTEEAVKIASNTEITMQICSVIYKKIKETLSKDASATSVKFDWDWYIWNSEKIANPIQKFFPMVPEKYDLFVWDGGEGYSDHPSALGQLVVTQLKLDGYNVVLRNGHLEVHWV